MTLAPHLRVARPSRDLVAAERFWVAGLGMEVLYRAAAEVPGEHELLMVGWPAAAWHLELTRDPARPVVPVPTAEDLLVLYLGADPAPALLERLVHAGGRRVPAANPYWDQWGVTIEDQDGYRLVLCRRTWRP